MKRRIFSILLTLVLVLTLGLVTGVPAGAQEPLDVVPFTLEADDEVGGGTATWTIGQQYVGDSSVELVNAEGTVDYAEIYFYLPGDVTLAEIDLDTTSFWCKSTAGTNIPYFMFEIQDDFTEYPTAVMLRINNDAAADSDPYSDWAEFVASSTTDEWQWEMLDAEWSVVGEGFGWDTWATLEGLYGDLVVDAVLVELSGLAGAFTAYVDDITVNDVTYPVEPVALVDDDFTSVTPGWGTTHFATIQDGVDEVPWGTVIVAAGTYVEEVIVDKPLTLEGANAGVPGYDIRGPESIVDADDTDVVSDDPATWVAAFFITSGGVTIDGFKTVDADEGIHVTCAMPSWGDRENVVIKNNYIDTSEGYPQTHIAATGIIFYNDANWHGATKTAYSVDGALVQDNYIDQEHQKSSIFFQDVNGSVTIKGNKIDGNPCDNGIILGATGALGFFMDLSGTVIEDNDIDGCSYGMQIKRVTTSSSPLFIGPDNNITGGGTGFRLWDIGSETVIQGNTITNNTKGFELGRGGTGFPVNNVSIFNNDILGNDIGIRIRGLGLGTGNEAHFNNIVGNDIGVTNEDSGTFDATYNWWGDISGPKHEAASFEDSLNNPGGLGNAVSNNVNYVPWLTRDFETVLAANIAYLGIPMVRLNTGWNTFSTPIALDPGETIDEVTYPGCNTWGDYVALGDGLSIHGTSPAYAFDPTATPTPWVPLIDENADYPLTPCDAIYVRMAGPDIAAILYSPDHSTPTKEVYQGWNLVGLAWGKDMPVEEALESLYKVPGDLTGYSVVISPPLAQSSWIFVREGSVQTMEPTYGYWVFMENGPDTLAGFTFTPMSLD